jgi:hypothetical protein
MNETNISESTRWDEPTAWLWPRWRGASGAKSGFVGLLERQAREVLAAQIGWHARNKQDKQSKYESGLVVQHDRHAALAHARRFPRQEVRFTLPDGQQG